MLSSVIAIIIHFFIIDFQFGLDYYAAVLERNGRGGDYWFCKIASYMFFAVNVLFIHGCVIVLNLNQLAVVFIICTIIMLITNALLKLKITKKSSLSA